MDKVCFVMIVYQSDFVLRECLESILPYGKVIVAEGAVSYFRNKGLSATSTDNTNAILKEMVGEKNVVRGLWEEKDEMMRATQRLVPEDTTHCWMVDSDEVFNKADIEFVLSQLDQWDSVSFTPMTFFGGFNHTLTGFEQKFIWYRIQRWHPGAQWATHRPPTVLAPDGKPYREHRHWACPIPFFHYSYIFPSQVKAKSEYYATRSDCIPNYFRNVWLRWVKGDDAERQGVENEFDGVHEWLPQRRGACRTARFTGHHPEAIQRAMPRLIERFNRELIECQNT